MFSIGSFLYGAPLLFSLWFGTRLNIIGLTGGIACGKSTVSEILKENNVEIIDADLIARRQMDEDVNLQREVLQAFG